MIIAPEWKFFVCMAFMYCTGVGIGILVSWIFRRHIL